MTYERLERSVLYFGNRIIFFRVLSILAVLFICMWSNWLFNLRNRADPCKLLIGILFKVGTNNSFLSQRMQKNCWVFIPVYVQFLNKANWLHWSHNKENIFHTVEINFSFSHCRLVVCNDENVHFILLWRYNSRQLVKYWSMHYFTS